MVRKGLKMISEFSNEVKEKLKHYVYRLVDPRNGQTFYVGEGCGNRVFAHANAIEIYLRQITLTGGIPFRVSLHQAPDDINADLMTTAEIHTKLQEGFEDIEAGRVQDAKAAFADFRESHR